MSGLCSDLARYSIFFISLAVVINHFTKLPLLSKTPSVILGEGGYDIEDVSSPCLSGLPLYIFSKISSTPLIGPLILRFLLNDNQMFKMVELAQQLPYDTPLKWYPMHRLPPMEYSQHENWAKEASAVTDDRKTKTYVSALDLHEAYKSGKTTPEKVIERCLKAIEDTKDFVVFTDIVERDELMRLAKESRERYEAGRPLGPLDGVPLAMKDELDMKGFITKLGSTYNTHPKEPATRDDVMVSRMRETGGIFLGKTTMTEFGTSPLGFNSHIGGVFNAYNKRYMSGGSSAGSAVAVALGIVPIAIAFDGGGSIRLPASKNGAFGISATFGRIAGNKVGAYRSPVLHPGPICATVSDCALAYQVWAPKVSSHFYTELYGPPGPPPPHVYGYSQSIEGLKFGFYEEYFKDGNKEHVDACLKAVDFLKSNGGEIVDFTQPHLRLIGYAHSASISHAMAFGQMEDYQGLRSDIEPQTRILLGLGAQFSNSEIFASSLIRGWAMRQFEEHFKKFDLIVLPMVGRKPAEITEDMFSHGISDTTQVVQVMKYVFIHNLLGFPSMTIPIGYDDEGLPIGLQFMAFHWREDLLFRVANYMEREYIKRETPERWVDLLSSE